MYLTAMTLRDELFDLTLRWMNDELHPDDGERVTRIFVYESAISAITVEHILRLLGKLRGARLHTERVRHKHELRERIISSIGIRTARVDDLAGRFHATPDFYFPHLPIDALVVTDESRLYALGRVKRMARIAEKVSHRLVEALFREIQAKAFQMARQRADQAGIPLAGLVSTEAQMQSDFVLAEEAVAHGFRDKTVRIAAADLTINDILGFKIVAPENELERIPAMLADEPGITIFEIQKHSGNYNAVNILLDIDLPAPEDLAQRLRGMDWSMARQRGLDPGDILRDIPRTVSEGARWVRAELILTTPEELMEAEFGRSLHELRILRLRQRRQYNGVLGQNAGYLVEYLLALASSPTVRVADIPIKLYGRYLPEEIEALKNALYGTFADGGLLGSFRLHENNRA